MKIKISNVFCKGDGFKVIVVCVITLIIGLMNTSRFETNHQDPIPTMGNIANSNTTNLISHLPIVRIGSGIR